MKFIVYDVINGKGASFMAKWIQSLHFIDSEVVGVCNLLRSIWRGDIAIETVCRFETSNNQPFSMYKMKRVITILNYLSFRSLKKCMATLSVALQFHSLFSTTT